MAGSNISESPREIQGLGDSQIVPPMEVHRDLRLCLTFFVDEVDRSGWVVFGFVCTVLGWW